MCFVGAPALAVGASWIVKHAFDRARPPWHLFERKGMQSFPSSHTAGKGALLWILATCCPGSPATRASAFFLAAADIAVVALTRVADGAHWPTDTLAGAAIGIAAAEALCSLTREPS